MQKCVINNVQDPWIYGQWGIPHRIYTKQTKKFVT